MARTRLLGPATARSFARCRETRAGGHPDQSRTYYGKAGVPICMFRLGTTAPERLRAAAGRGGPPPLHSPGFWPDARQALACGVPATVAALRALLAE